MITIDLGSAIVSYAILIGLAILGFTRGFRYMLSIAFFITIGYLLTIQGGNFVVGLINRFYSNSPKLVAFGLGRDPSTIDALGPLIPENLESPLLLRVLVFFALLAIGIGYAWPWEGKRMSGFSGDRPLRILGTLTGLYVAVLGMSAISTFWNETGNALQLPDLVSAALNGLPNFVNIIPSVIAAFLIVLVVVIILRFDRIWKP